jgi:hypothetical protein
VKDIENPSNLAYTNRGLAVHSDQPYIKFPPRVSSIDFY